LLHSHWSTESESHSRTEGSTRLDASHPSRRPCANATSIDLEQSVATSNTTLGAIPTADIVGRVNDFRGWYQISKADKRHVLSASGREAH
jgi:hypothetical protein